MSAATRQAGLYGRQVAEEYALVERDSGRTPQQCNPMTDWADPVTLDELLIATGGGTHTPSELRSIVNTFKAAFDTRLYMLQSLA